METTMKKPELVFVPSPGISHIASILQMAKLITARDRRISIVVFLIKRPGAGPDNLDFTDQFDQTRIRFVHLREPDSSSIKHLNPVSSFFASTGEIQIPIVREALTAEVSGDLAGILVDMFCACLVDLADEFHVPSYIYFPCGVSSFGLMNHLRGGSEFMNLDGSSEFIDIPIFSDPYPRKVLPLVMVEESYEAKTFLDLTKKFNRSNGIVVNTFLEMESRAISVVSKNEKFPPIYAVGPLLNHETSKGGGCDEIIRWLDAQPPKSVVYLCFGSVGAFEEAQVREIAVALERSGHRFLWSLKMSGGNVPPTEVLPEGFLERTRELGKLIGWAPQVEVLSHDAVGGFVSHCGWNSTLESVWYGVPMAAWPLYAEQQMNAFLLVKELELAVEVKMDYHMKFHGEEADFVNASVIESSIMRLMNDRDNDLDGLRKRVKDMSLKSRKALTEGGSSYVALGQFVDVVINNIS